MSSLAFRAPQKKETVHLSVTPLIDVLFLLIIFFTLTSTFKRAGELELQLPDSSSAAAAATDDELHVAELVALESGVLQLDGTPVDPAALDGGLRAILAEHPDSRVLLKAETNVPHGKIVELLDAVRGAGFGGVALGTHRLDGSPVTLDQPRE